MATRLFGGVKTGATSVSLDALLLKTSDGTADTGKAAAALTAYYYRQGASATASVTLSDLAALNTAWASGGVKEIADGTYRVDWPDAAFATGADWVELTVKDGTTSLYKERIALESAGPSDLATTLGVAGAGLTALGDTRLAYLDAAVSSRSTYAGADTSGTMALLARLTSTRAGNLDNLDAAVSTRSTFAGGAVASVTGAVSLDLSQAGLTPRALDSVADSSLTVGDALVAAISAAAGKESLSSTTYTVKTPSTGTTIRTFTLDSATSPTSRS